ncbi:ComEA family DNA-binding protein [Salisaeta longa]|uniref:ComEA family DNA-binding protein n=1 Tax=Salisaeta longa TaxID=503170 RepID=UPI0003B5839D|nr:helix-hairpin-helix domain-containing protein [Salisaeta longa]
MRYATLALLVLLAAPCAAQPADTTDVPARTLDAAAGTLAEQTSETPTQLAERLMMLAAHPRDVNQATAAALSAIPALTPALAQRIVNNRRRYGPFPALDSLLRVPGLTPRVLYRARPYLRAARDASPTTASLAWPAWRTLVGPVEGTVMQRYSRRLDLGRGYRPDSTRRTFRGGPARLLTRLRLQVGSHLSARLTLDKDPGEAFGWNPATRTYGYDHAGAALALRNWGRLRTLIVGDYTAAFGQGVALWRGMAFGKGRAPVEPLLRQGDGLSASGSTAENRFLRGLAATVALSPTLSLSGWASRRTLDASLDAPDTTATAVATSLPIGGLHRTTSELARKDALRETLWGGAITWNPAWGQVGAAGYHTRFGASLGGADQPYERFDFQGDRATMLTTFGHATWGSYTVLGEIARSPRGHWGGIAGAAVSIPRRLDALVMARHYPRRFTSLHGYAFGERNGATQNETGVYLGLRVPLTPRWTLAAAVDQFRFPWLRFAVPRPTSGYDARLVLTHEPFQWLTHYVQLRHERKGVGTDVPAPQGLLDGVTPRIRQSVRWHARYAFSETLELRTRLEGKRVHEQGHTQYGLLLYQDVTWQATPWLRLDARVAAFDTDDYASRIFAYERDLLYAFSVPAFFGEGHRTYLLVRARPWSDLTIEAKYGVTRYRNVRSIGSGLNETPGQRLRSVGLQVRWTFGPS